ncbi:MAG: hypothetical protein P1U65_07505 [Minwuia sp.]|nr:hypothetical protein [Minwuia sp.]
MSDTELADLKTRLALVEQREAALERKNEKLEAKVSEVMAVLQRGRGAVYVLGGLGVVIGMALGWFEKIVGLLK